MIKLIGEEKAKELPFYPDYLITSMGRVYSKLSKKWLHPVVTDTGYYSVTLTDEFKSRPRKRFKVHILVAKLFCYRESGATQVNHIDNNKLNNNYQNLEWVTPSENRQHYLDFIGEDLNGGTRKMFLTEEKVREIKRLVRSGVSQTQVAKLFNCRREHICNILAGRRWKTID